MATPSSSGSHGGSPSVMTAIAPHTGGPWPGGAKAMASALMALAACSPVTWANVAGHLAGRMPAHAPAAKRSAY
eukprot:5684806-Lingulodinium_polyedra.AAC.1